MSAKPRWVAGSSLIRRSLVGRPESRPDLSLHHRLIPLAGSSSRDLMGVPSFLLGCKLWVSSPFHVGHPDSRPDLSINHRLIPFAGSASRDLMGVPSSASPVFRLSRLPPRLQPVFRADSGPRDLMGVLVLLSTLSCGSASGQTNDGCPGLLSRLGIAGFDGFPGSLPANCGCPGPTRPHTRPHARTHGILPRLARRSARYVPKLGAKTLQVVASGSTSMTCPRCPPGAGSKSM